MDPIGPMGLFRLVYVCAMFVGRGAQIVNTRRVLCERSAFSLLSFISTIHCVLLPTRAPPGGGQISGALIYFLGLYYTCTRSFFKSLTLIQPMGAFKKKIFFKLYEKHDFDILFETFFLLLFALHPKKWFTSKYL